MFGQMLQIVMLVATTHGVRALGRWAGPRWGGLLTGVPSTTALVLVGFGVNGGLAAASTASEACLVGLVAASALPLAYARAASAGWRWPAASGAAVGGYAAVASALWWLPATGTVGCVAAAAVGLAFACHLAARVEAGAAWDHPAEPGRAPASPRPGATFTGRTAVPVAYFGALQVLRPLAGAGFVGRFVTFPGASLAVLASIHREAGPGTACRTAAAMPFGGLGMLAFLTAFRFGAPRLGLGWGTAAGYAAAFAVLGALAVLRPAGRSRRRPGPAPCPPTPRGPRPTRRASWRVSPPRQAVRPGAWRNGAWPRRPRPAGPRGRRVPAARRGFAPRLEPLAG